MWAAQSWGSHRAHIGTELPDLLAENGGTLRAIDPGEQSIAYRIATWARYFGGDPDFDYLAERCPRAVARRHLAEIARTAASTDSAIWRRRLFLGTMFWGYGKVDYGPHRTRQMLDDPRFDRVIRHAFNPTA